MMLMLLLTMMMGNAVCEDKDDDDDDDDDFNVCFLCSARCFDCRRRRAFARSSNSCQETAKIGSHVKHHN